jgi:hypothetical protein
MSWNNKKEKKEKKKFKMYLGLIFRVHTAVRKVDPLHPFT